MEAVYTEDLNVPEKVVDSYIKSALNGDLKYTFYYTSGRWKQVEKLGALTNLAENNAKNKARRRFTELFTWKITPLLNERDVRKYSITVKSPSSAYLAKRVAILVGIEDENGNYTNQRLMTEDEALNIVHHEKNLPIQTDKFTIRLKKNQYGWVVDGLDDGVSELTSFLNNS